MEEQLSFNSEHRLRSENLSWDIDVWYPLLKQHSQNENSTNEPFTFETIFLPLTITEAKAIVEFHNTTWRHMKQHLKQHEILTLLNLETEIDQKLKLHFPNGAFVRLCGRSPKDGEPFNKLKILQQYQSNYEQVKKQFNYNDTITKMIAIAKTNYLKVYCGEDVMSLLLTSERVYADMIDWIKFGEPEQICLRDWSPEMSMDYEFRVFVCSDTITAISQYDHYCYYPHLQSQKDFLKEGIETLWKKIHFRIGVSSYVMDVAYLSHSQKFIIIEFSPFFPCTGPALFNWTRDNDILEGREPFEFRLKSQNDLHPQIEDLLDVNWDDRWKQCLDSPPYYSHYEMSEEEAEKDKHSILTKRNKQRLIKIGMVYLQCCLIGILTTLIYLIQLITSSSTTSTTTQSTDSTSTSLNILTCLVSSLVIFFPLQFFLKKYFVYPKITSTNSQATSSSTSTLTSNTHSINSSHTLLFVYGTLKRNFQWNEKYLHNRGGNGAVFLSTATTRDKHRLIVGDSGVPYLCLNSSLPDDNNTECTCNASSSLGNSSVNLCTCLCESCQHNIHRPNRSWTGDTAATSLAATSLGISSASHWSRASTGSPPLPTNSSNSNSNSSQVGERVHGEVWLVSAECLKNLDDYEGITKQYYQRKRILVQLHDGPSSLVIANVYSIDNLPIDLANGPFLEEYSLEIHREFYRPIAHIQVKQLNYIQTPSTWGNVQEEKLSNKGMKNVSN